MIASRALSFAFCSGVFRRGRHNPARPGLRLLAWLLRSAALVSPLFLQTRTAMRNPSRSLRLSRPVGAFAATLIVAIVAGCMSFSIGGKTSHHVTSEAPSEDGVFLQQGVARMKGNHDLDVFYPVGYQHPPNLELGGDSEHCGIVDGEDHFRLHSASPFKAECSGRSRGQPSAPPRGSLADNACPPRSCRQPPAAARIAKRVAATHPHSSANPTSAKPHRQASRIAVSAAAWPSSASFVRRRLLDA